MSTTHKLTSASARTPRRKAVASSPAHRLALTGLVSGLLLGLVCFAPARWLAQAVSLSGMVHLDAARGTVWQGSAQVWLTGGHGSPDRAALPQRLAWRIAPAWTGLRVQLRAECCTPQPLGLTLTLQDGAPTLRLGPGASDWPADVLAGLGTPWNMLKPQGRLLLRTQGLQLQWTGGTSRLSGAAELELQDASSALSTLQPMGSYRIALSDGGALELQTLRGDLQLSGRGQWQAHGLRFSGEARVAPGREDALANILNIIGRRDGERTLISLG